MVPGVVLVPGVAWVPGVVLRVVRVSVGCRVLASGDRWESVGTDVPFVPVIVWVVLTVPSGTEVEFAFGAGRLLPGGLLPEGLSPVAGALFAAVVGVTGVTGWARVWTEALMRALAGLLIRASIK
jgi:hypothetical protein